MKSKAIVTLLGLVIGVALATVFSTVYPLVAISAELGAFFALAGIAVAFLVNAVIARRKKTPAGGEGEPGDGSS